MLIGEVSAAVLEVAAALARKGARVGIVKDAGGVRLAHQEPDGNWVIFVERR